MEMIKHVLIVEDHHDSATFLAECMKRMGFHYTCERSFENVLANVPCNELDFAIIDIFLPGMGGIEGIKRLKSINKDCLILAVSGGYQPMSGEVALQAAKRIGADAVLAKPVRLNQIRLILNSFVACKNATGGN